MLNMLRTVIFWIIRVTFIHATATNCSSYRNAEHCLVATLTDGYQQHLRPLRNASRSLDVSVHMEINSLDAIDVREELMQVHFYLRVTWCDEFFTWNPEDYDGLGEVTLNPDHLWTPTLVIYNSANGFNLKKLTDDFPLTVNFNGHVSWGFAGQHATRCQIHVTKYPYDKQTCTFEIGNWAHDRYTSNLFEDGVGFSALWSDNSLWKKAAKPKAHIVLIDGRYPKLVYTFTWERQSLYYELNMILPSVLLLAVSCCLFRLPVESGEKIGLSMAVLIAFSVFHNTVLGNTPTTSEEMPGLVVFVLVCMILSTLATMSACLVIYVGKGYERSNVRAPARLLNTAIILSRIFHMTDDDPINRPELEKLDKRQHEWRFMAAMLDQLLFYYWLVIYFLFCVIFFSWARLF